MEVELDDLPSSQLAVPIYSFNQFLSSIQHTRLASVTQSWLKSAVIKDLTDDTAT